MEADGNLKRSGETAEEMGTGEESSTCRPAAAPQAAHVDGTGARVDPNSAIRIGSSTVDKRAEAVKRAAKAAVPNLRFDLMGSAPSESDEGDADAPDEDLGETGDEDGDGSIRSPRRLVRPASATGQGLSIATSRWHHAPGVVWRPPVSPSSPLGAAGRGVERAQSKSEGVLEAFRESSRVGSESEGAGEASTGEVEARNGGNDGVT